LNEAVAAARDNQAQIDALWDLDDPTASEGRFRAAASSTADSQLALILGTQVARALGLQRRFDEALAVQRALAAEHAAAGTADPYVQEELTELESALKAGSPQNQAPADPPATP